MGRAAYGKPTGPVRFHEDETVDATFNTYRVSNFQEFRPEQRVANQVGQWSVDFWRLVVIPA